MKYKEYEPLNYGKEIDRAFALKKAVEGYANKYKWHISGKLESMYKEFLLFNDIDADKLYSLTMEKSKDSDNVYDVLVIARDYKAPVPEDTGIYDPTIVMNYRSSRIVFHLSSEEDYTTDMGYVKMHNILFPYPPMSFFHGYKDYGQIGLADLFVSFTLAGTACAPIGGDVIEAGLAKMLGKDSEMYRAVTSRYEFIDQRVKGYEVSDTTDLINNGIGEEAMSIALHLYKKLLIL